jgi:hypothetical protein
MAPKMKQIGPATMLKVRIVDIALEIEHGLMKDSDVWCDCDSAKYLEIEAFEMKLGAVARE